MQVLPFGASEADFAVASRHRPAQSLIDFADGNVHLVYAGRCGADMVDSLTALFRAFRLFRKTDPVSAARIRFHFIGTGYAPAPAGADTVLPVARAEGVADLVHEHRSRVPYFDALYYLRQAHALVAVGSNDPTYSASKLFPYILARRPLLLLFHSQSLVLKFAADVGAGMRFALAGSSDVDAVAARICAEWFVGRGYDSHPSYDEQALLAFTAESLTARLAAVFNEAAASVQPVR
jgi:hypothetical protein